MSATQTTPKRVVLLCCTARLLKFDTKCSVAVAATSVTSVVLSVPGLLWCCPVQRVCLYLNLFSCWMLIAWELNLSACVTAAMSIRMMRINRVFYLVLLFVLGISAVGRFGLFDSMECRKMLSPLRDTLGDSIFLFVFPLQVVAILLVIVMRFAAIEKLLLLPPSSMGHSSLLDTVLFVPYSSTYTNVAPLSAQPDAASPQLVPALSRGWALGDTLQYSMLLTLNLSFVAVSLLLVVIFTTFEPSSLCWLLHILHRGVFIRVR